MRDDQQKRGETVLTWPRPAEDDPDEAVLVAAARENPEAFGALYARYVRRIYQYCYVRLGDTAAAEDATSEIFMKALANLPRFAGGTFAAWLFRIASNVVVDAYRRRRVHLPLETAWHVPDVGRSTEATAVAHSEVEALHAALVKLPEEQRRVVELDLAGWTGPQIAAALGKSAGNVRMMRFRALKRLRAVLAGPSLSEKGW